MSSKLELINKPEPLLPELQPYVVLSPVGGMMVHHPLVVQFFDPERCAELNHRYQLLMKETQKCFKAGDFQSYIFWHARPYRLEAFMRCVPPLAGPDYWRMVASVWTDSENIHQHRATWRRVWSRHTPGQQHCMDKEAQAALAALPDVFTVWRGINHWTGASIKGLSWSLERDRSIWFARRYTFGRRRALLVQGEVQKRHVLAHFNSSEQEIVSMKVQPLSVTDITRTGKPW